MGVVPYSRDPYAPQASCPLATSLIWSSRVGLISKVSHRSVREGVVGQRWRGGGVFFSKITFSDYVAKRAEFFFNKRGNFGCSVQETSYFEG